LCKSQSLQHTGHLAAAGISVLQFKLMGETGVIGQHLIQFSSRQGFHLMLQRADLLLQDWKSTRLNSSHVSISYAVFCLKKITHGYAVGKADQDECGTRKRREAAAALKSGPVKDDIVSDDVHAR